MSIWRKAEIKYLSIMTSGRDFLGEYKDKFGMLPATCGATMVAGTFFEKFLVEFPLTLGGSQIG